MSENIIKNSTVQFNLLKTILRSTVLMSIFCFLVIIKSNIITTSKDSYLIYAATILILCVTYIIYYVFSEGIIKNMIAGFFISLIGMLLVVVFPPLGIIIAIIGVISMISKVISIVKMIPLLCLGILLTFLLFAELLLNNTGTVVYLIFSKTVFGVNINISTYIVPYLLLSFIIAINYSIKYNLKYAIFRLCIMFLAIPVVILLFYIIRSKLRDDILNPGKFQNNDAFGNSGTGYNQINQIGKTYVKGYWRSLPKV